MWARVERVLSAAMDRLGATVASDLPGVVAMAIVLCATFAAAFGVRWALRRGLARAGFDRRAREWGMTTGRNLESHHEPSWLVARGTFWFVIVTGVALALDVLGASTPTMLGTSILGALPRLVVGAVIMLVGVGAARYLERSALIGAVNLQVRQARPLALGVKWLVLVLAAAMALEHVGVGGSLATSAFAIVLGGIVLAAALAVGLGARGAVARALERYEGDGAEPPGRPPRRAAGGASDDDRLRHL